MYSSFSDFQKAQMSFSIPVILNHAQIELWFVLRSHRYRYIQLRKSTRSLSIAAAALLIVVCVVLVNNLINRL
jgi:predicted ABC-type exoprotein transport system permease subunit